MSIILIGLVLVLSLFSARAAGGETILYDDVGDAHMLTDPETAFGTHWPSTLNNTYASPESSLFPTLSGSGNRVTVSGVTIDHIETEAGAKGYVLGGLWYYDAGNNVVTIQNGAVVGKVYGGAALGTAHDNRVYLTNGATAYQVTGGLSVNDDVNRDTVTIRNSVFISNAISRGIVRGGWNGAGTSGDHAGGVNNGDTNNDYDVLLNSVSIEGLSTVIEGNVYGGYNEGNSETRGNTVTIAGGTINPDSGSVSQIAGGYSSVTGGTSTKVYDNHVEITGGEIRLLGSSDYSGIYGGRSQGGTVEVYGNTVSISGGTIAGKIVSGGSGGKSGTAESQVLSNAVDISGGIITANVAGGRVNDAGTASGNNVILRGGKVIGDVYGAYDGTAGNGAATIRDNWVDLVGGTVQGNMYAGYEETGTSTNNKVNLYGGEVTGFVSGSNKATAWTTTGDNTLYGVSGLTNVGGIDRFENAVLRDGARVNVTGSKNSGGNAGYAATFNDLDNNGLLSFYNDDLNQGVGQINGNYSGNGRIGLDTQFDKGLNPANSDSVVFTTAPDSTVVFTFNPMPASEIAPYINNQAETIFATVTDGTDLSYAAAESGQGIYSYVFRRDGDNLMVGFNAADAPEKGKVYTDGSATGLSQVALLADTFLQTGLERAVASICCPNRGFGISASVGYAAHRIGTGGDGHADLRGFTGQLALAYNRKGTPVNVGLFGEMFDGWYRTADTLSLTNGVFDRNARGELESYGGGLFFQYRKRLAEAVEKGIAPAWIHGPHLEAVAHAGWSVMDFETVGDGATSRFDNKGAPYYGASLGGGYVVDAFPNILADVYGHGRWVRQGGRSAVDGLGQRIELDAADSLRLVAGVRAARRSDGIATPYAGLAAEWEVLGKPGARIDGYEARRADLSGVSALIELGVGIRARDCVYVDLKAYGSVGRRRGIGGVLEVMYAF